MMKTKRIIGIAAAAGTLLAACGGGIDAGTADTPREIEIESSDFAFSPDPIEVIAGETVTFVIDNVGAIEHELVVTNQAAIDEHLAEAVHEEGESAGEEDAEAGEEAEHGSEFEYEIVFDAGETARLTVTFSNDNAAFTKIACLIPGHYESGMVANLEYIDA
jgi:uncharacterized cupredoxin-like copper-binding protein